MPSRQRCVANVKGSEMRRAYCGALILLTTLALVAGTSRDARAQTEVPAEITLNSCGDTRAPVEFPHEAHFETTECVTCHHSQEDLTLEAAAGMEVEVCSDCHVEPEEEDTPSCTERSLKKNSFHIRCVDCHKEVKAEDETLEAPTKCAECHPKAEGEDEAEEPGR